jgi:hypothetical protein
VLGDCRPEQAEARLVDGHPLLSGLRPHDVNPAGAITFGKTGSLASASIFPNATGANLNAINWIFTSNMQPLAFDLMNLDLGGLALILADLGALHVGSNGQLTGPVP